MAGKFVISKAKNGKFHFVLKAGNSEVILQSQMYEDVAGALNGVAAVKTNAANEAMFERLDSTKGEPYFNLKSSNGQVVGRSEMYSSARARDNGIESVRKNAPEAAIDDQSAAAPAI